MERHPFAALVMLLGTTVALGLSIGVFTPLIAARLDRDGVAPLINGLTSTVMYLAIGLGALLAGRVIKSQGVRRTFLAGAIGLGLTSLCYPALPTLAAWFVFRAFSGGFAALFFVSTEVAVSLIGDPARRARNLALYGVAFSVGFSTGAASWPFLDPLGNWPPFLVVAAVSILAAGLAPFLFPDARPPVRDRPERRKQPRMALRAPLVIGFSYGFCEAIVTALLPVCTVRLGFSNDQVGWFFVLVVGSGLVTHIPVGIAADRVGPMPLTRAAASIALAGVCLPLLRLEMTTIILCCVLAGIGVGSMYTLGLAEVGRRVDIHTLAAANARFTASYGVGSVLGPALGGLAIMLLGPRGFFWSLAACLAVLTVVSFAAHPAPAPTAPPVVRWRSPVNIIEFDDCT
ncbi:MAG: MFS transporter [Deltaproteobacteria bacterium]|nr:MFS transporter [Deltaproteobacteria bacterium]